MLACARRHHHRAATTVHGMPSRTPRFTLGSVVRVCGRRPAFVVAKALEALRGIDATEVA
jgi:hypothetical protein